MKREGSTKPLAISLYPHEIAWLDAVVAGEPDARKSRAEVVRAMIRIFSSADTNPFRPISISGERASTEEAAAAD